MHVQLWLLATVLLAMGAFTFRALGSGRSVSARVQKQGSSPFLGHLPMEFAYWLLSPIGKLATQLKLSPNLFSWTCLVLGFAGGIAAALGSVPLAGGLSIISALFDALDGIVARSRGIASDAGEVLDAAVDRYTEFFLLAGLCIYYRHEPWAMVLAQAALLGSFMVSYSQAKAESLNVTILYSRYSPLTVPTLVWGRPHSTSNFGNGPTLNGPGYTAEINVTPHCCKIGSICSRKSR